MTTKTIILASDHAGFKLKSIIGYEISESGHKVLDLGTNNTDAVDYSDYGHLAAKEFLKSNADFGFIFCKPLISLFTACSSL